LSIDLFVPGRLEVFGKHTDYAGGRSLVAAVPRGFTVSAEAAGDGRVRVEDVASGETAEFSACGEGPDDGWRTYPRSVIRRLAGNFPDQKLSARIRFSSNLPQAAGISSSSALVIAIAESLLDCWQLESSPAWQRVIRSPEDRAGYFGCIENGASFGSLAGDAGVGTHGGSEDHAAIVMSRAGELRLFSYSPIRQLDAVAMPAGWTFAIARTGVDARKAGAVRSDYNRLADAIRMITMAWRERHPGDTRSLGQLAREGDLRASSAPAALRWRLDHFMSEDLLAAQAADAFARGDIAAIGELATASHTAADRLLGNQIDETRILVSDALMLGAAAASAFGAGWGGSVWALIRTSDAEAFLDQWLTEYRRRFPGRQAEGFISPPSSGLRRL
jgi:galactokinase